MINKNIFLLTYRDLSLKLDSYGNPEGVQCYKIFDIKEDADNFIKNELKRYEDSCLFYENIKLNIIYIIEEVE